MKTIAELEQALAEAQAHQTRIGMEAANSVRDSLEWEWTVKWSSPHVVYVAKQLTEDSRLKIQAHNKLYPTARFSLPQEGGMRYGIAGNLMFQLGGGLLVLKSYEGSNDPFCYEPRTLTDEEVQAFREGRVPDSLKR